MALESQRSKVITTQSLLTRTTTIQIIRKFDSEPLTSISTELIKMQPTITLTVAILTTITTITTPIRLEATSGETNLHRLNRMENSVINTQETRATGINQRTPAKNKACLMKLVIRSTT